MECWRSSTFWIALRVVLDTRRGNTSSLKTATLGLPTLICATFHPTPIFASMSMMRANTMIRCDEICWRRGRSATMHPLGASGICVLIGWCHGGAASKGARAISHAWVANENLKYEMTPINGYEWPVPMPKDADLDCIRIEMLNLGAEYIWLDVLCLRQEHQGKDLCGTTQEEWDDREILRKEEWKVDLPMIGWVYHSARQVVCYLSGLGLPLSFKTNRDFEDDRCWFNRAWTLQETPQGVSIAGRTCHNNELPDERFMTLLMHLMLDDRLRNLRNIQQSTGRAKRMSLFLEEMKTRKSSKPVDKVTGLVYLLQLKHIPIYDVDQCEEDAWTELMNAADGQLRATFLFLYPKPNGDGSWRPSWQQLMTESFHDLTYICRSLYDDPNVHWTEKDGDWYGGPVWTHAMCRDWPTNHRIGDVESLKSKIPLGGTYLWNLRLTWIRDTWWPVHTIRCHRRELLLGRKHLGRRESRRAWGEI